MKNIIPALALRYPILELLSTRLDLLDFYVVRPYVSLTRHGVESDSPVTVKVMIPTRDLTAVLKLYGYTGNPIPQVQMIAEAAPHTVIDLNSIASGRLVMDLIDYDVALQTQYPFDKVSLDYDWNTFQWRRMSFVIDTETGSVLDYVYYWYHDSEDEAYTKVYTFDGASHQIKNIGLDNWYPGAQNYNYFDLNGINVSGHAMTSEANVEQTRRTLNIAPPFE